MNVQSTRKIISSYDVVFDESLYSTLLYLSQPNLEAMNMQPAESCIPCATSLREQTDNIITFAQFEEGGLLSETRHSTESGDKSKDNSIMPPLIIKEEMEGV